MRGSGYVFARKQDNRAVSLIRRRLFWKVYLTMLTSLVAVAVLMGTLWWLLGESPQERWVAFRVHLADSLAPGSDRPTGTAADTVPPPRRRDRRRYFRLWRRRPDDRLARTTGAACHETAAGDGPGDHMPGAHVMRIDLPDGRTVLARVMPPPGERLLRILTAVLVVVGGVGLGAFPMTARLTRQLERLRSGMERWGAGEMSARVDDSGSDEVALVARSFNQAAERVTSLLAAQRALLANASHELRSPLTRLRMGVDLWLKQPDPAGRDEIVRNLAELDELVGEILLSSRLDHPGSALGRLDRVDLLGLAAEEAARIGAVLEGDPVEITGNETLLRRLLRNLLENATSHGRPPVCIAVSRDATQACIAVSDEGAGIPPDERERVFEPFYRPAGSSEAGGGWGLGLSLVRQIAERHGGRVTCEGEAGRGSRFVVRLSAGRRAGAPRDVPPGPHRSTAGRRTQPRSAGAALRRLVIGLVALVAGLGGAVVLCEARGASQARAPPHRAGPCGSRGLHRGRARPTGGPLAPAGRHRPDRHGEGRGLVRQRPHAGPGPAGPRGRRFRLRERIVFLRVSAEVFGGRRRGLAADRPDPVNPVSGRPVHAAGGALSDRHA